LILTPGNTADCTVGPACVSLLDGIAELLGDTAYDSNSFRKSLCKDGIKPVIPGRSNRKKRIRHDKQAYKDRNVIERCYCRLADGLTLIFLTVFGSFAGSRMSTPGDPTPAFLSGPGPHPTPTPAC
jgi:hypothetical protein